MPIIAQIVATEALNELSGLVPIRCLRAYESRTDTSRNSPIAALTMAGCSSGDR